jgi:hypothetical protein
MNDFVRICLDLNCSSCNRSHFTPSYTRYMIRRLDQHKQHKQIYPLFINYCIFNQKNTCTAVNCNYIHKSEEINKQRHKKRKLTKSEEPLIVRKKPKRIIYNSEYSRTSNRPALIKSKKDKMSHLLEQSNR